MLTEIEQEIAVTPATSAAAPWGKIRIVMYYGAEAEGALGDDLVASLLADMERLIRGATS
jgi:hypothetical protein